MFNRPSILAVLGAVSLTGACSSDHPSALAGGAPNAGDAAVSGGASDVNTGEFTCE